jgi:hypothetical protein
MNYGFSGGKINLIGHSWGAYVADELAAETDGGVNVIVALDPAANTVGSDYNPNDRGTIDFQAHSRYSVAFHTSEVAGNEYTPVTAHEAFTVQFLQVFWTFVDIHRWIQNLFTSMVPGNGGVSRLFTLERLLTNATGQVQNPWQLNRYKANDAYGTPPPGPGNYEGVISSGPSSLTPTAIRFFNSSGVEQTILEQTTVTPSLSLGVTPTAVQTKDWTQTVQYTLTVTDGTGAPVSGASVAGNDDVMAISFQAPLTNTSGVATYTTTVPSGKANGTYNVTFLQAAKTGYTNSASQTRQVTVQHATETAYLRIYTSGSGLSYSTNVPKWGGGMQIKWDFNVPVTNPSWWSCGGTGMIIDTGVLSEDWWFYPNDAGYIGDYGLGIDPATTSVTTTLTGQLQLLPAAQDGQGGGFFEDSDRKASKTSANRFSRQNGCQTSSVTLDRSYLYSSGGTELRTWYVDVAGLGTDRTAGIKEVRWTFNGWLVPAAGSASLREGTTDRRVEILMPAREP